MNGQTDRRMDGCVDRWMNGWVVDGQTDGQIDGWVDRWMKEWVVDGQMDGCPPGHSQPTPVFFSRISAASRAMETMTPYAKIVQSEPSLIM